MTPLPGNILLTVDLTRDLPEGASEEPLVRLLAGAKPTLRDFLDAIEAAGNDPRVKVLLARVGDDELGLARVQEVRDAIAAFRSKGKLALAFADSFGEFGPGTRPYYLATAFDEIWLQPMGNVGLTGLYARVAVLEGDPRPSRGRPRVRPSRRIQDRDEYADRNQDDAGASRRGRGAARLGCRADRPRDRAGPQIVGGRGARS